MYTKKPSVVIINGINGLGLEISKKFGTNSSVVVVGKLTEKIASQFPRHVSVIDNDSFSTIKLSKIKTIIILYHEKLDDMVSASDLVVHAKFLSDLFHIANVNKAKILITTSLTASKQHAFAKYSDKNQPYDFPSFQNFVEKLTLEQSHHSSTFILRIGDLYGDASIPNSILYRMLKDTATNNFIRVDEDGLEKMYPISNENVADHILYTIQSELRGGIYTLAPQDGLTQMAFANMCMQYSSHVSHIKFTKTKYGSFAADPLYENIYSIAPYLPAVPEVSAIEKELPYLIRSVTSVQSQSLRTEDEIIEVKKRKPKSVTTFIHLNKPNNILGYLFLFLILLLLIIPQCLLFINTKLLTEGNDVFFQNYNNPVIISEISTDSKYNKDKAQSLSNSLQFDQWVLPIFGSDYKANQDFLNAEVNYFDALSNSQDYKFFNIDNASRGIIQIKLQSAKSLIDNVDKNKLFLNLKDKYDNMRNIIDSVNI